MSELAQIKKQIRDLARRSVMMLARGVISKVYDEGGLQLLQMQVLADEVRDRAERIGEAGFFSFPLEGAAGVVISLGGDRSHSLVIATDDKRHRPRNGTPGDVGLVHPLDDATAPAESASHRLTLTERDGETWLMLRCDHFDVRCGDSHIYMNSDKIRFHSDRVETVAREIWKVSVNGYGENWIFDPGSAEWRTDNYKTDPKVVQGGEFAVDPPEHGG